MCVCVWRKWLAGRRTDGQQDGGIRPRQQVPAAAAVHVPLHVGRRHDACCISASQRRSLASTSSTSSTRLHTDTHAPTINHRRAISFPPLHPNSFPSPFLSSLLHFPHLLSFPFPFHSLLYLPSQSSPSIHLGTEGALHFYHSYICFFSVFKRLWGRN